MEDNKDYGLDDMADPYGFFVAIAAVASMIAIFVQIKNMGRPFLTKQKLIGWALIPLIFQAGTLLLVAVKTAQIFLVFQMMGDTCIFLDCD